MPAHSRPGSSGSASSAHRPSSRRARGARRTRGAGRRPRAHGACALRGRPPPCAGSACRGTECARTAPRPAREDVAVAAAGDGPVGDPVGFQPGGDLQRVDGALAQGAVLVQQDAHRVAGCGTGRHGVLPSPGSAPTAARSTGCGPARALPRAAVRPGPAAGHVRGVAGGGPRPGRPPAGAAGRTAPVGTGDCRAAGRGVGGRVAGQPGTGRRAAPHQVALGSAGERDRVLGVPGVPGVPGRGLPESLRGPLREFTVDAPERLDVLPHREQFQRRARPRGGAQPCRARRVAQQRDAGVRQCPRVARGDEAAGAADHLRGGPHVGGDGGPAAEHRLHQRNREALDGAGEHGDAAQRVGVRQGGCGGTAQLLEGDRALDARGCHGEEPRCERPAVRPVSPGAQLPGALPGPAGPVRTARRRDAVGVRRSAGGAVRRPGTAWIGPLDDAQPGGRHRLAHPGEGVQQGVQVLGRAGGAHPHQRGCAGGAGAAGRRQMRGLFPDGVERCRVHAGVDGAQPRAVGAAALLPAACVRVPGGDQMGLRVRLARQAPLEGGEQGPYGGAHDSAGDGTGGARQVVLTQPHAVLGDQQRHPERPLGPEAGEGRGPGADRVAQVGLRQPRLPAPLPVPVQGERTQRALQLVGDGKQVTDLGGMRGGHRAGRAAGGFQDAHGALGAQRGGQPATLGRQFGEPVETGGETVRLSGGRGPCGADPALGGTGRRGPVGSGPFGSGPVGAGPAAPGPSEPGRSGSAPQTASASTSKHSRKRCFSRRP